MAHTIAKLLATKGPEEPIRPIGLCQGNDDYIAGREDFLFGRSYRPQAFADWSRQNSYHCGWAHEKLEAAQ